MEAKLKNIKPTKKLDKILGQTLDFIEDGEKEIYEIRDIARKEYDSLEKELIFLKTEASALIVEVDKLYQVYNLNRKKLAVVDTYSEEEVKLLQQETELLRLKLEEQQNKERVIIQRRNDLEIQLRSTKDLSERADKLSSDFNIAISLLNGNIRKITDTIDNINNKQVLGIKILQVQEEERRRIAREMHDGLAQQLSQVLINAEFSVKLLDKDINMAKREMNSLKNELRGSIKSIRHLIYDLRPMSLDDLGLIPTIQRDVDLFRENNKDINIELVLSDDLANGDVEMSETIILTIYRIFQEAINNIKKHSHAKNIVISMKNKGNVFHFDIADDGIGFNKKNLQVDSTSTHGFGVSIMKERVDLLRGNMSIDSKDGIGTKICISIPLR